MEYVKLNGLKREASRIGLGTWSIGNTTGFKGRKVRRLSLPWAYVGSPRRA
jgi:aryl-alcohol dehydrogenase-like predicted oxidoreductase